MEKLDRFAKLSDFIPLESMCLITFYSKKFINYIEYRL